MCSIITKCKPMKINKINIIKIIINKCKPINNIKISTKYPKQWTYKTGGSDYLL